MGMLPHNPIVRFAEANLSQTIFTRQFKNKYKVQAERFSLKGQTLWLSTERGIFWEEQKSLIVSDLHFGKTGHFRKSGIAVPQSLYKEDMQRLANLLQAYKPQQLIVVGDLFHSAENKELDLFKKWRADFGQLHILLVKGNHDILKHEWYDGANIAVADKNFTLDKFCFIHDIADECKTGDADYFISGHVHPCVTIRGLGRQSISLPCYYFSEKYAVLPAFSKFTGGIAIEQKPSDHVFAIIGNNAAKGQVACVMKV